MTYLDFIHAVNRCAISAANDKLSIHDWLWRVWNGYDTELYSVIDYPFWQSILREIETDISDYYGPQGYYFRQRWIRKVLK
jgi:hypothetical protein